MDIQDNYVVTSDSGTASEFLSNFAYPIRVERGHKIALKSIFYGPKFNVTDDNNHLWIDVENKKEHLDYTLIENGWYPSIYDLFQAIAKSVNAWTDKYNTDTGSKLHQCKFEYLRGEINDVKLTFDGNAPAMNYPETNKNILTLLTLEPNHYEEIVADNTYFSNYYPGFIYASVVENSYIDNIPSRLLAIIPMESGRTDGTTGYHFYKCNPPTYYNFAIHEFSHIKFELRDSKGQPIEFDHNYTTIMMLEVFKPLDISL